MATLTSWNDIPHVALISIYRHLNNTDRLNVACTCKSWNTVFNSSTLWRERKVRIEAAWPERKIEQENKFIDKFGHGLCKLTLFIGQPSFKSCMPISKAVDAYVKHICRRNDIHLRELDLEHLHFQQNWHFILSRNRLVTALCRLLRKQKCLTSVYISGARMRLFDGCRMLEAMTKGFTGRTIVNLFMEDFFELNVYPCRQQRFITALSKFHALEYIHINYRYINAVILRNFANKLSHCLKGISMILDGDVRGIEVPADVWYEFTARCPLVKLNICLCTTILRGNDLRSAFVREMPLSECYITSYSRFDDTDERLGVLLRHLGDLYHSTLVNFAMFFEYHERIDDDLLYMLGKCRVLKDVCIQCRLEVHTVIGIMRLLHGGRLGMSRDDWTRVEEEKHRLIPNGMEFVHIGPNELGSSIGGSTVTADEDSDDDEPEAEVGFNIVNEAGNDQPEIHLVNPQDAIIFISDEDDSSSDTSDDEVFLM